MSTFLKIEKSQNMNLRAWILYTFFSVVAESLSAPPKVITQVVRYFVDESYLSLAEKPRYHR